MADKKISALTPATLPLAGTEELPLVQSSTTKKVTADDLTVKNIRSNATSGLLQIAGPAAASTRVMTVPDANFTAARTDAANSFTGDQTLATGNLIVATAGKGLDFSANTNRPGMTSELLTWYEEGTWTPNGFGGTVVGTLTTSGRYTRIGRFVSVSAKLTATTSVAITAGQTFVNNLPYAAGVESTGTAVRGDVAESAGIICSGSIIYSTGTVGANANMYFSITYTV